MEEEVEVEGVEDLQCEEPEDVEGSVMSIVSGGCVESDEDELLLFAGGCVEPDEDGLLGFSGGYGERDEDGLLGFSFLSTTVGCTDLMCLCKKFDFGVIFRYYDFNLPPEGLGKLI